MGRPWKQRVGIIGLGLMGGSLARELAACRVAVRGFDPDPHTMAQAEAAGVLEALLPPSLEGLEAVDLLVVAVPVDRAADAIAAALPRLADDCVVTDVGSTKRSILATARRLGIAHRFVGSHPLTGGHRSGWSASHRDLYAWRRVFLCPTPESSPEAVARVTALWELVGALPELADAAEHDRRVGWTSHLPQAASSGLALSLAAQGYPRDQLGPGGQDTTRLAGSSAEMWTAICLDNADVVEAALADYELRIGALRQAVQRRDRDALHSLFSGAREWADEQPLRPHGPSARDS